MGILKRYSNALILAVRAIDLLIMMSAAFVANFMVFGHWDVTSAYKVVIAFGLLLFMVFAEHLNLYRPWRGSAIVDELWILHRCWVAVMITVLLLYIITQSSDTYDDRWLWSWLGLGLAFLTICRLIIRIGLRALRKRGFNQRHIVLAGLNDLAHETIDRLRGSPWSGLNVKGYFDDQPQDTKPSHRGVNIDYLGDLTQLVNFVDNNEVDQVWITFPLNAKDKVEQVLYELRHHTIDIRLVLDIFSFRLLNHSISDVAGLPILNIAMSPTTGVNGFIKSCYDRVLAVLAVILLSPFMLLVAVGIKLTSPGPVFYCQERIGWNNRPFVMYKFRTMPVNVENTTGPIWSRHGESRATQFGTFLRRTSLDELPQLLNVLKGDMSLVGPRPERPHFVEQFKDQVPDYMKKHMVKAGMTGWAQVNGWRGDSSIEKRIEYDLYYIKNWSIMLDLKILLLTIVKGFIHSNAH